MKNSPEVQATYEAIAQDRPHVCTGCGATQRLSHSHLIPKSRRKDLEAERLNITYHCLSMGDIIGCHQKWEGMRAATLNDFEHNFNLIYGMDREYFWLRLHKLESFWFAQDKEVCSRIRKLMSEKDNYERHQKNREDKSDFLYKMGVL